MLRGSLTSSEPLRRRWPPPRPTIVDVQVWMFRPQPRVHLPNLIKKVVARASNDDRASSRVREMRACGSSLQSPASMTQ